MSEIASYWGVDEHGIPYPLKSVEEWHAFYDTHPDRIRIGWDEWKTSTQDVKRIQVSTKFFGTDYSTPGHLQRCMFETVVFLDGKPVVERRIETRKDAEDSHTTELAQAERIYPPKERE